MQKELIKPLVIASKNTMKKLPPPNRGIVSILAILYTQSTAYIIISRDFAGDFASKQFQMTMLMD